MWSSLVSSLVPPIDAASQVRRPQIDSDYENVRSHLHPECGECEPSAASTSEATPRSTTTTGTALCGPMPHGDQVEGCRVRHISRRCALLLTLTLLSMGVRGMGKVSHAQERVGRPSLALPRPILSREHREQHDPILALSPSRS
jgi:hypothetical protein